MSTVLKVILLYLLVTSTLYGLLAGLTYHTIQLKIEKMELLETEYIEKEAQGEVSYSFKQTYEKEYELYNRLQTLFQSFWMKWIFDFPEFRAP
ncbi:hypothetical protein [Sutcliffiella deserti]|uniref:hypothetical protein n=1 Tax=Sutcliffiella deserti TaxID=2875501 RepID=UPI001CBE6044|nr:hypothetical protein [Sutcliffiella deserti]